jgi:hypothetical protein
MTIVKTNQASFSQVQVATAVEQMEVVDQALQELILRAMQVRKQVQVGLMKLSDEGSVTLGEAD